MKVFGVGSCEGMVNSQLEGSGGLVMVVDRLFTAMEFSGFGCLPPQRVVVGRWTVDECVGVGKMPRDPVVGIKLLKADHLLVQDFPALEGSSSCHTLLISSQVHQLQPGTGEGEGHLSCEGSGMEVIDKVMILG